MKMTEKKSRSLNQDSHSRRHETEDVVEEEEEETLSKIFS